MVVFAGKKTTKTRRKMPEIWKNFNSEVSGDDIFQKISAKCKSFEVSSLGVFDEVSVSKF